MTLSTAAKNYIATNLGRNDCYADSGISCTDAGGGSHTYSTYNVVKTMNLGGKGPNGERFWNIPGSDDITAADIASIRTERYCVPSSGSGGGGSTQCNEGETRCNGSYEEQCINGIWERNYCPSGCSNGVCNPISGGTSGCTPGTKRCNRGNIETCNSSREWAVSAYCQDTCSMVNGVPTCTTTPSSGGGGGGDSGTTNTGPLQVIIKAGVDCGTGAPTVRLDTSEAFAYFSASPVPHVGVMDLFVQNNSGDCYAYFVWEMRMWKGKPGTRCPTSAPLLTEISRFLGEIQDTKTISPKMLGAGENLMVGGSFEIPSHYEGTYTICLTLWGNFSKQALLDELPYPEDIVW